MRRLLVWLERVKTRRLRFLSAVVALAAATLAMPARGQGNLVHNGDFEQDSAENPPAGWAMWGARQWKIPSHFTRDTTQRHGGKASFRIHHPKQTQGYTVTAPERAIRPKEGMTYAVSFWANADAPVRTSFGFTAYESIRPFRDAPTPAVSPIQVGTDWKEDSFRVQEGLEFFATRSQYLLPTFRATSDPTQERTIWVDDVVVTERPSPGGVRLIDEDALAVSPVEHGLHPGDRFEVTLDAQKIARPVMRDLAGIWLSTLGGGQ